MYHLAEAKAQLVSALTKTYPDVNLDSLFRRSGIYSYMTPNLVFDRTMTELTHAESNDYVAPTLGYVRADEKIVSKGEIVTAEIAQILDSYKKEYNQVYGYSGPRFLLYAGNFIIAALLTVLLFLAIWTCARFVFGEYNRYLYILALFLLAAIITYVIELANPDLMYLIPYPVLALYLLAFFR